MDNTSYWFPLFSHMSDAHGLTLINDEMEQIAMAVGECQVKGNGVAFFLVNALRFLSQEELVILGTAIASRCGHRLEPSTSPTNDPSEGPAA